MEVAELLDMLNRNRSDIAARRERSRGPKIVRDPLGPRPLGPFPPPRPRSPFWKHWDAYAEMVYREVCSAHRIHCEAYAKRFFRYLHKTSPGVRTLQQVALKHIIGWLRYMHEVKRLHASTITLNLHVIAKFFRWSVEEGLIAATPVQPLHLPKFPKVTHERRVITYEEYLRLISSITMTPPRTGIGSCAPKPSIDWKTAFMLAWHTGLRLKDICLLEWLSIDLATGILRLSPSKTRRFGKTVEIPLDAELVEHLIYVKGLVRESDNLRVYDPRYVCPDLRFIYICTDSKKFQINFKRIARRAGVAPDLSFTCFRHGFVSRLLNAGVSPAIVCSMTGHSITVMEQHYMHISIPAKASALQQSQRALHQETLSRLNYIPQTTSL